MSEFLAQTDSSKTAKGAVCQGILAWGSGQSGHLRSRLLKLIVVKFEILIIYLKSDVETNPSESREMTVLYFSGK